jgi:hypothetical protein
MNRTRAKPVFKGWPAPRQRLQTAIERIDEFLKRNGEQYDQERINLAMRIVFGDDPELEGFDETPTNEIRSNPAESGP